MPTLLEVINQYDPEGLRKINNNFSIIKDEVLENNLFAMLSILGATSWDSGNLVIVKHSPALQNSWKEIDGYYTGISRTGNEVSLNMCLNNGTGAVNEIIAVVAPEYRPTNGKKIRIIAHVNGSYDPQTTSHSVFDLHPVTGALTINFRAIPNSVIYLNSTYSI